MRETFGLPYTQHETYYVMDTSPGARDLPRLARRRRPRRLPGRSRARGGSGTRARARSGTCRRIRAIQHRLHLIPAGTPHASGAGNVVLEISATPYLYTLRFYDWLRRDLDGELRPVHLAHAFANLDPARSGDSVRRELIPEPTTGSRGCGLERARARQASRPLLRRAPARLRRLRGGRHRRTVPRAQPRRPATRSRSSPGRASCTASRTRRRSSFPQRSAATGCGVSAAARARSSRRSCRDERRRRRCARHRRARMSQAGGSRSPRRRSSAGAGSPSRSLHSGGRDRAARGHLAGDPVDRGAGDRSTRRRGSRAVRLRAGRVRNRPTSSTASTASTFAQSSVPLQRFRTRRRFAS